ncbi:hypothetical protein ALC56_02604 [Trachymyrmex septentrionalis]|uniref:Uncharacterized protein n=1 Tax=Trachymyrmex septentrionalis TaxID=34720 RepID=A0A195FR90_9HYME|nr:hypothetical protein ALC56_02604 [Trachymyrmex septentrionalis]
MAISTCVPRIRVTRDNAPACIVNAACLRCPRFLRSNLAVHWLKKFTENLFGHELVETNTTSFDIGYFLEIAFSNFNIEVDIWIKENNRKFRSKRNRRSNLFAQRSGALDANGYSSRRRSEPASSSYFVALAGVFNVT